MPSVRQQTSLLDEAGGPVELQTVRAYMAARIQRQEKGREELNKLLEMEQAAADRYGDSVLPLIHDAFAEGRTMTLLERIAYIDGYQKAMGLMLEKYTGYRNEVLQAIREYAGS